MILLQKFNSKEDLQRLLSWVDSAYLNAIWSSKKFKYPLDEQAFLTHFRETNEKGDLIFKVVNQEEEQFTIVGHAELVKVGEAIKLSRLLIAKEHRSKGYGEGMMHALFQHIKQNLAFNEIILTVFSFNTPAISLYKKMGFVEIDIDKNFMHFEGESWDRMTMKREDIV